jgi:hypothetical protein
LQKFLTINKMGYFIPFGNGDNYVHSIVSVTNSTMPILNLIFNFECLCFVGLIGGDLWSWATCM